MRVIGAVLIVVGLLFSLTVVGAIIGIPMMLIGLVMVIAGRSNRSVVVNVTQNGPQYHPHAQPYYPPHPTTPPAENLAVHGNDPLLSPLPSGAPVETQNPTQPQPTIPPTPST